MSCTYLKPASVPQGPPSHGRVEVEVQFNLRRSHALLPKMLFMLQGQPARQLILVFVVLCLDRGLMKPSEVCADADVEPRDLSASVANSTQQL